MSGIAAWCRRLGRQQVPLGVAMMVLPITGASLTAQVCEFDAAAQVAVRSVVEGIVEADNERDLDRVLGYYTDDAVLRPPGESDVRGRDQIRPRYAGLFSAYDPEIVGTIGEIRTCGDLAVASGHSGGVLRGREGRSDQELSDAFLMVLKKVGEVWYIDRLIWHPDR